MFALLYEYIGRETFRQAFWIVILSLAIILSYPQQSLNQLSLMVIIAQLVLSLKDNICYTQLISFDRVSRTLLRTAAITGK